MYNKYNTLENYNSYKIKNLQYLPTLKPTPGLFKVGDSVSISDNVSDFKHGCVLDTPSSSGIIDICGSFRGTHIYCADGIHTNINDIKKIQPTQVPCGPYVPNCNIAHGCSTAGEWPQQFKTQKACEDWAGSNSTWGTCVKVKVPYSQAFWTLGCHTDSDCGKNRKCINDKNPLNHLRKTCSCKTVKDCQYPNSRQSECIGIGAVGTMDCPKTWV